MKCTLFTNKNKDINGGEPVLINYITHPFDSDWDYNPAYTRPLENVKIEKQELSKMELDTRTKQLAFFYQLGRRCFPKRRSGIIMGRMMIGKRYVDKDK